MPPPELLKAVYGIDAILVKVPNLVPFIKDLRLPHLHLIVNVGNNVGALFLIFRFDPGASRF